MSICKLLDTEKRAVLKSKIHLMSRHTHNLFHWVAKHKSNNNQPDMFNYSKT
jgi:hypothetical protein